MMHQHGRAVVIDDDLLLCKYFEKELRGTGIELYCAHTASTGIEEVFRRLPDIILLDLNLPDKDGFDVCRELKADARTAHIPIMFITATADAYVTAFQAGADDCLTKPIRGSELQARVLRSIAKGSSQVTVSDDDAAPADGSAAESDDEQHRLNAAIAEVDQILGVVGHELRTPLAGLRVMSEFLLTDSSNNGKPHEFLQAIHEETIRLSNMVNNLLESARISSGKARWRWSEFAVEEVCKGAMKMVCPLADARIRFICDVQPETMMMHGDRDAIQRLLLNLLSNAQKHTSEGTISVHARRSLDDAGAWIELSVADTGQGIPQEMTEKLGVPFALNGGVTSDIVGSGLGLSICKSITAAHGGKLVIESVPSRGTTVVARMRADLKSPIHANPNWMTCEAAA